MIAAGRLNPGTRTNKPSEERMDAIGTGFELRMELTSEMETLTLDLDDLHEGTRCVRTRDDESLFEKRCEIVVVHLVAMTMAFDHRRRAVERVRFRVRRKCAFVVPETKRTAEIGDVLWSSISAMTG